ncbi:hypothetical protein BS47DRAFT_1400699 [Hydnum rufescens UP504]|uniref:Uncharacterized protein n=1 Tax=Hydnum rufescens UP504 TaxID=1448309 RepID=A0A9P6DNZ5_9AGAM|nr:hypothetical protein BS47DRAFT_1400699 [Hydnum rufescens UP504]
MAEEKLGEDSIDYLLDQFKEQHTFQIRPIPWQSKTKGLHAIEHILSMSQSVDSLRVHLRELTDELAGLVTDTRMVALEDELQLKITEIRASVWCLESNIAKKTEVLHLSDQKSHKELEWLKTNKWINLQLNIRVVRDQLLMKLRACKFELAGLEHADTSCQLDHKTKEHVEKAMKGHVSGIQATLKCYEDIRKQMMKLRGKGNVARDAYIPPEISSSVYKLDVDDDIWQVPHHEDMANFPGGKVPAWLADKEVCGGIQHAQELVNCHEELRCCKAELSNLRSWFSMQCVATQCTVDLCNELHRLHDLVDTWKHHTTGLAGSDGQLDGGSIPDRPPPLRRAWVCQQGRVQAEKDLSPGEGEEGDLGASSDDDDENGELEEQPELEDLTFLTSLDLVLGHED